MTRPAFPYPPTPNPLLFPACGPLALALSCGHRPCSDPLNTPIRPNTATGPSELGLEKAKQNAWGAVCLHCPRGHFADRVLLICDTCTRPGAACGVHVPERGLRGAESFCYAHVVPIHAQGRLCSCLCVSALLVVLQ